MVPWWMVVHSGEAKNPACRVPGEDTRTGRTSLTLVNGGRRTPRDPTPLSEYWTHVLVVPLPDTARFPAEIHAIDQTASYECAWTIDARGRADPL